MLQTIEKNEVAARKPYRYSTRVLEKMAKVRKEKRIKKEKMARSIVTINMLEFDLQDENHNDIRNACGYRNKVLLSS